MAAFATHSNILSLRSLPSLTDPADEGTSLRV